MRIACLHTAHANIAVFDSAAQALGIEPGVLRHEVRADLLAAAVEAGGMSDEIAAATASALLALAQDADAVLLTCSTLGPCVERVSAGSRVPILRTDQALAFAATQGAGNVVVLCAIETTLEPTAHLFRTAAQRSTAAVDVQLVGGAWALYKAGNIEAYLTCIAQAADRAYREGASVVALGQASMSPASLRVTAGAPPLTSAATGLEAVLALVSPERR